MNTLLLSTNTANCTTKNLKMMAAVICLTAVFVFTNMTIFAQQITTVKSSEVKELENNKQTNTKVVRKVETNKQQSVTKKTNTVTAPQTGVYSPAEKVDPNSTLPYYNYKGIADLSEAKKLWVAENPEAYKKLQGTGTPDFKATNIAPKQTVPAATQGNGSSISSLGVQPTNSKSVKPVVVQKTPNGQLPNSERRKQSHYDDSKTNVKSKE